MAGVGDEVRVETPSAEDVAGGVGDDQDGNGLGGALEEDAAPSMEVGGLISFTTQSHGRPGAERPGRAGRRAIGVATDRGL